MRLKREYLANARGHFRTVNEHRHLVRKYCFRAGLYRQGLLHDLSKYSPTEFIAGVKYYQGNRSPNDIQRKTEGLSAAWLHHKGRNKHHYEFWTDYLVGAVPGTTGPVPMPKKYIAEMFCDRTAACHIYGGENFDRRSALNYFEHAKGHMEIHSATQRDLELLLRMSYVYGEAAALKFIRKYYLKGKPLNTAAVLAWLKKEGAR